VINVFKTTVDKTFDSVLGLGLIPEGFVPILQGLGDNITSTLDSAAGEAGSMAALLASSITQVETIVKTFEAKILE
jgi:hypothetical protein